MTSWVVFLDKHGEDVLGPLPMEGNRLVLSLEEGLFETFSMAVVYRDSECFDIVGTMDLDQLTYEAWGKSGAGDD